MGARAQARGALVNGTLRAGSLRDRVTLQNPPATDDGAGGQVGGWTTVAVLNADVRPMSANQQLLAGAPQGVTVYRVTVRYRAGISSAQRLLWRGQALAITGVMNPDGNRVAAEIMCLGGLPT